MLVFYTVFYFSQGVGGIFFIFSFFTMKESFYFKHDYNARQDPKILKMLSKQGLEGYGIYWALVEIISSQTGKLFIPKDYEAIAYELRTECDRIKSVVEEYDLFEFDEVNIWNNRIDTDNKDRVKKSKQARDAAKERWRNKQRKEESMRSHKISNAESMQGEEKRGEEKRGEESISKEISTEISQTQKPTPGKIARDFFNSFDQQNAVAEFLHSKKGIKKEIAEKEIKKFVDYWTEPTKSGKKQLWQTKPTFEVKRRLSNWLDRSETCKSFAGELDKKASSLNFDFTPAK